MHAHLCCFLRRLCRCLRRLGRRLCLLSRCHLFRRLCHGHSHLFFRVRLTNALGRAEQKRQCWDFFELAGFLWCGDLCWCRLCFFFFWWESKRLPRHAEQAHLDGGRSDGRAQRRDGEAVRRAEGRRTARRASRTEPSRSCRPPSKSFSGSILVEFILFVTVRICFNYNPSVSFHKNIICVSITT